MELKVVKEDEKTMILEIVGGTVGFTNLLNKELWNDSNVKEAAQVRGHPYLSQPQIFVKVSRGNPRTALEKAAIRIENKAKEFGEEFRKALKK